MFQSLIGKLQTEIRILDNKLSNKFQSLIGKLQTLYNALQSIFFPRGFNPL